MFSSDQIMLREISPASRVADKKQQVWPRQGSPRERIYRVVGRPSIKCLETCAYIYTCPLA